MESDRYAGQFPAEGVVCTACRLVPPPFDRAVAYGVYEDEIRTMLHLLKYERMRVIARPLGAMLAEAIRSLAMAGEVVVVAVPLHPKKERQRGYNQTILLADEALALLRKETGVTLRAGHQALIRLRDTESQYALTSRMRRLNLRGAFAVKDAAAIAGRTVLLVDDIYTTGATAKECTRVLLEGGAAKVLVATLARAQAERVEFWDAAVRSGEVHT
jgi:ComF family protein